MKKWIALFAALGSMAAFAADTPKDVAQKALDEVQSAYNAHDASKLAQTLATDATWITPEGKTIHSRTTIQKDLKSEFDTPLKMTKSTLTLDGTRAIGANAIWVDATHALTDMVLPDGSKGPEKLHVSMLLEKKDGKWLASEVRSYQFLTAKQMGTGGAGK